MRLGLAVISMVLCPATAVSDPLQESWCIDALEQVAALQASSPVYKPTPDGPQFIDDADRPAEIARLQKIIRTSCSTKPKERSRQESEAFLLHVARSPECVRHRMGDAVYHGNAKLTQPERRHRATAQAGSREMPPEARTRQRPARMRGDYRFLRTRCALGTRFEHDVERRLCRTPEARKSTALDQNLAEPAFASLRAQGGPMPRQRYRYAD